MRAVLPVLFTALGLVAMSGCTGGAAHGRGASCGQHAQCADDEACIMGVCADADREAPLDVSGIDPRQWYVYNDGSCVSDDQCGPWVCHDGMCAEPSSVGRVMPPRGSFAYWDASCLSNTDCGEWVCVQNWCSDPAYISMQSGVLGYLTGGTGNGGTGSPGVSTDPYANGTGTGQSCLGDADCAGGDCISPGYCHNGRGGEAMTFSDIQASGWFSYGDGSCAYDTDCGAWVCNAGWCVTPESAGRDVPPRSEFEYYDSSCNSDTDCPSSYGWGCLSGWCFDTAYAYNYSPDPYGNGQASGGGYADPYYGDPYYQDPYDPYYGDPYYDDPFYDPYYDDPYIYDDPYLGQSYCSTHAECGQGGACVYPGTCQAGAASQPANLDSFPAQSYFTNADGKCGYDNECGPWMCAPGGYCAAPSVVGRQMQAYEEYRYYDTSCSTDADCGGWICASGWCTQPGYAGP